MRQEEKTFSLPDAYEKLIEETPAGQLIGKLNLTAFDELMDIDLSESTFVSRYHADGKFFTPVITDRIDLLIEYVSTHMVHPEDRETHLQIMDLQTMEERLAAGDLRPGVIHGTVRYLALDGNWRRMYHLLIGGEAYGLAPHHAAFYLFDIQDALDRTRGQHTDLAESKERLRQQVPDLLPEATFFALSDEQLKSGPGQWCMVAIDIKHYKLFKELNGQEKGERLLIRFGEVLHQAAKDMDGFACYRGQDDYGLFVPFEKSRIDQLFADLCGEIDKLSSISGFFPILGICLAEEEGVDAVEMFNRAALTSEEIKDDLRFHVRVYDSKLHDRHVEEFKLLAEFNEAMAQDQIHFFVQPQVDIRTGRIVGAESLARWQKTDGTFVPPTNFVSVLEKYGVITDLDIRIWDQVCAWLRSLLDRGLKPVPISVNVSRMNIFSVDVPEQLTGLMNKYRLPAELLEVEITESAYVDDSERVSGTIAELRKRGFRVLMDDFGSGYSSLNMLRTVEVDVIKLDAQFLRFSVGEERKGINILESVINMTKSLSTPIIIEGVETMELVQFLRDMGCRYMQGFYYYRPMPKDQFEILLKNPDTIDYRGIVIQRNQQMHTREFLDENLYSDAMLNNILGPVAFYSRKAEDVDIIRFNQQFVELIGLESEVLEERRYHIQNYFYPEDLEKFFTTLDKAAEDHINGASGLFRIYKPNGALLWMQLHVYLLRRDMGKDIFYGSARDMTELQFINQDLPGGYYRAGMARGYELIYVSQTMLQMFGYTSEEIRRRFDNKLEMMIHPEDREMVWKESEEILQGLRSHLDPYRILHADGKYRYVMDQSRVTDQYGETCWQSVIVDITEVMTLRNRMRLLEKYSSDCILFLRDLSHPEKVEVACYGLEDYLGMPEEEFRILMTRLDLPVICSRGKDLRKLLTEGDPDCGKLNGVYTISSKNGPKKCHVRISRICDPKQDVECIISIMQVSGS